MTTFRLGAVQQAAVQIYVTDPAHELPEEVLRLEGERLVVTDLEAAFEALMGGANSCSDGCGPRDMECWRALTSLAQRVGRAMYRGGKTR